MSGKREDFNSKFSESAKNAINFNNPESSKALLKRVGPVKVNLKLKHSMWRGLSEWECTLRGKKRLVTLQNVEYHCETIEEAVFSFNQKEVEEVTITGKF